MTHKAWRLVCEPCGKRGKSQTVLEWVEEECRAHNDFQHFRSYVARPSVTLCDIPDCLEDDPPALAGITQK